MIAKNIDYAFIGNNYPAILIGLEALSQGKNVLIVDDEKLALGDLYIDRMTAIPYAILKKWDQVKKINLFCQENKAYTFEDIHLLLEEENILLGRRPHANLRELLRKFPQIFESQRSIVEHLVSNSHSFDQDFFSCVESFGEYFFQANPMRGPDESSLSKLMPESISIIYQCFLDSYPSLIKIPKGQVFFFSLHTLYQKILSYKLNKIELFYFVMSVLSPNYRLKTKEWLTSKLISLFQSRGGILKKTPVNSWSFHKNHLWCIELASYEGITCPKQVVFFAGKPTQIPFAWGESTETYDTMKMATQYDGSLEDGLYIFAHVKSLGTFCPLIFGPVINQNLTFYLPLLKKDGGKVSFFAPYALQSISKKMINRFPKTNFNIQKKDISFTGDLWSLRKNKNSQVAFYKKQQFNQSQKLKNVHYYGPLSFDNLGPVAPLLSFSW